MNESVKNFKEKIEEVKEKTKEFYSENRDAVNFVAFGTCIIAQPILMGYIMRKMQQNYYCGMRDAAIICEMIKNSDINPIKVTHF